MKKFFKYLILLFIISSCGCGSLKNLSDNSQSGLASFSPQNPDDIKLREELLAEKICEIEGVTTATVIVRGETALIGIRLSNNEESNAIKTEVDELVRNEDKNISSTAITTRESIIKMIEAL